MIFNSYSLKNKTKVFHCTAFSYEQNVYRTAYKLVLTNCEPIHYKKNHSITSKFAIIEALNFCISVI